MQINSSSGQIVKLDILTNQGGVISIDVDSPQISVQFFAETEFLVENYCIISTAKILQTDGSYALSIQFRIPFMEQGVDGEVDIDGVTPMAVVSEITITGAVINTSVEVI